MELNDGAKAVRNLKISDRRRNASMRPRSAALENPQQAGEAYTTTWQRQ